MVSLRQMQWKNIANSQTVQFQDESREIASEYKGGLGRYSAPRVTPPIQVPTSQVPPDDPFALSLGGDAAGPAVTQQPLPPMQPYPPPSYPDSGQTIMADPVPDGQHSQAHSTSDSGSYATGHLAPPPPQQQSAYSNPEPPPGPPDACRDYLTDPEEVLLMQVFVDNVGLWMDTYDPMKHVCDIVSRTDLRQC